MGILRILIVEDEAIIAEDLRVSLLNLGYNVAGVASCFEEATKLMNKGNVDFVITDIMLGGQKDGVDLAMEIQKKHQIPFIFLSSHSDKLTVERAKEAHPGAYLLKPFDQDDIFTAIEVSLL